MAFIVRVNERGDLEAVEAVEAVEAGLAPLSTCFNTRPKCTGYIAVRCVQDFSKCPKTVYDPPHTMFR